MLFAARRLFLFPLLLSVLSMSQAMGATETPGQVPLVPQPTPDRAYLLAVSEALDDGDYERGERLLRARLEFSPDDAIAWEALGVALALQNKAEDADDAYGQAVELDPSRLSAWVKRGDLAQAAGSAFLSQLYWREALDIRPDYSPAAERLARALAETGDYQQAVPLYETVVAAEDADDLGVKPDLGLAYNQTGRAADTLSLLAPWDDADARAYPLALLALGNAHAQLGQPSEALARYERGLAAQPNNGVLARAMGALLVETGDAARAVEVLADPAAVEPPDAFTNLAYARALAGLGQYPDAIAAAERAETASLEPTLARQAISVQARSHLLSRDPDAAVAASSRLVELAPEDAAAWREHIAIVAATAQYDQALALYDDALTRFEGDPQLLRGRSITNIRLNNLDAALSDAAQAVEAAPNWVEPRYLMGEISLAKGQGAEAEAAFLGVLEVQPDHWPSLLKLAQLAQDGGALTEAQEFASRAVAVSGGAEAAQTALAEIEQQLSKQ